MVDAHDSATVDHSLTRWLAVQALHDRDARLVDGGSDADDRIELARLFIDLPVSVVSEGRRALPQKETGIATLLHALAPADEGPRVLLVGGPGSGKSTLTAMLAQMLRLSWLDRHAEHLPQPLHDEWQQARSELASLRDRQRWPTIDGVIPLRVNLPSLARWMASHRDGDAPVLWQHLATRAADELAAYDLSWEVTPARLRQVVEAAGPIVWILDGLDEVPRTAGRAVVLDAVRAVVCDRASTAAGLLVATRPQGYEGEFDELDTMMLLSLPAELARDYGARLIRAWTQRTKAIDTQDRLQALTREFAKPEVGALLQTPLHTTIAAVLVAGRGTLPKSRYLLFNAYFATVLKRELQKPFDHQVLEEDESVVRALHAQAGLLMHVRAQAQQGARASLRRRELGELLSAIYQGLGYEGDERRTKVERLLRFSAERLVLLIHDVQGEYSFGVRSLQEFFAAEALMEGDVAVVAARLDAVLPTSHWSNVVAFVVSQHALATTPSGRTTALRLTAECCAALNRGEGSPAARRCLLGSHLALAMLREVQPYASPWLSEALWEVAFEAAETPAQETSAATIRSERFDHRRVSERWWDVVEIHVRLGLTAASQEGECGRGWRKRVRETAAKLLGWGGEASRLAWRLLHGLLKAGDADAEALATRYAPTTEDDAWAAFSAGGLGGDRILPAWWCDYLNAHPGWFTPGALAPWVGYAADQNSTSAVDIVRALLRPATRPGAATVHTQAFIRWGTLEHLPRLPATMPEVSEAWRVWHRVAGFLSAPSRMSLAELLDELVHPDALRELYVFIDNLPWPLATCVECVYAGALPQELARDLRNGELGDLDDWRAAARRLTTIGPDSIEAWQTLWASRRPWPKEIGSAGVPIPWNCSYHLRDQVVRWLEGDPDGASMALRMLARSGPLFTHSIRFHEVVDRHLLHDELLQQHPWSFAIHLDPVDPELERWLPLLENRGRHGLNTLTGLRPYNPTLSFPWLFSHLREHPAQWGLLDAVVSLLDELPDLPPAERTLPAVPDDAPPRAHAQHALITLCGGRFAPTELPALLAQLTWNDDAPHDLRAKLAQTLQARAAAQEPATELLLAVLDAPPPPAPDTHDTLLGALFNHARNLVPPAFSTPEAWHDDHHLPPPFLSGQSPPELPPVLVSIDTLRNVRLFTDTPAVDAPFPRPPSDRGQWIVLVGENGVGKTTLLRALALALLPAAVASKLLDERLPLLRNGEAARIAVTLDTGRHEIVVRRDERTEVIDAINVPQGEPPWVVAYGVRRGNALGEKDRAPELGAVGEVHTLFERPAALYPAAQWLRDLDGDVLREARRSPRKEGARPGPRRSVWNAVVLALKTILEVTDVAVEEGGTVYVTHPAFGRVPFEAMSDGYLSTAGWIVDMIARWIDRQRDLDEPVGPNVLRQMCGLALLDEIDLHLHPVWQLRIISDVRRLFPRMSFVVTTHNPLALHGARAGEIFVMRRDGAKLVLTQRDIRPGQDIDRVLLEQFGVKHTLDEETRRLLDTHRAMIEQGVAPGDPARQEVETRLVERFGDVAETLRTERSAEDVSPLRDDELGLLDDLKSA